MCYCTYDLWESDLRHDTVYLLEKSESERGWGGSLVHRVQDCCISDPSLSPDPPVWLDLSSESTEG